RLPCHSSRIYQGTSRCAFGAWLDKRPKVNSHPSPFTIHLSLLVTRYLLLVTRYLLLVTRFLFLVTCYLFLVPCHLS
ncbi:MAG TPA: hypothetical protein DCM45_02280, partial [Clostridiales bacterium]|nr:hypothetical protein [Clostridiales bacterium]